MNRRVATLVLTTAALSLVLLMTACAKERARAPEVAADLAVSSHGSVTVDWADDWDSAFVTARSEEKPVMAVFYADWCIWCKRLDSTTLADSTVTSFIGDSVVAVRLDIDNNGKALSRQYRVEGPPTIIVFSSDGTEMGRIPGYLPPDGFLHRVQTIL